VCRRERPPLAPHAGDLVACHFPRETAEDHALLQGTRA
jgi:hypothetical protein